jgi:hypothetical protein
LDIVSWRALGILVAGALFFSTFAFHVERSDGAFIHPAASYAFGETGTGASTFPNITRLAYQEAEKKLYALSRAVPTTIHAFNVAGPASFTPTGGLFPLEVEPANFEDAGIGVDNTDLPSSGHLMYSTDCGCPKGPIYVFNASGELQFQVFASPQQANPNGGLEAVSQEGIAVDGKGQIWVANSTPNKIEVFPPTGGPPVNVVPIYTFAEGPVWLAFDYSNEDLYLAANNGVWRLTAASGYSPASARLFDPTGQVPIAVDAHTHRLFVARTGVKGVKVYNTITGTLTEEFGTAGVHPGIAVDEATDTVFLSSANLKQVQEWKPVIVPDVTTGPPVGNKTVSGSVGLAGGPEVTECYFEYGTEELGPTKTYPSTQACSPAVPYAADQPSVSATLSLSDETTYFYRLVARNANGLNKGENQKIKPTYVAFLKTQPASNIQRQAATLNATFEGTGENTLYHFEWGPTTEYGNSTPEEETGVVAEPTAIAADLADLEVGTRYHFRVVAQNSSGVSVGEDRTFVTAPPIKDINTTAATEITSNSADLHGSLDPDGYATQFYFEYGQTTSYGHTIPGPPGNPVGTVEPGIATVSQVLEGLESGTTYHYRLVAENSFGSTIGPDETVTTTQAPSLIAVSSENVTANTADLTAVINTDGFEASYQFEYGTTLNLGSSEPALPGELPAGSEPQSVVVHLEGLEDTTYFFRLVAESRWGRSVSEIQSFEFSPQTGCPNSNVRQQTRSAYLPDCRAYELVSPARAGGAWLWAIGPYSYVSSPARFAFVGVFNGIPGSGDPQSGDLNGDLYAASRTTTGWVTSHVSNPGYQSIASQGPLGGEYFGLGSVPADIGMNRFLVWDKATEGFANGTTLRGSHAPYMYDNEGHFVQRLPTNLAEVPGSTKDITEGGFVGDERPSPDFSHYAFSSRNLAFASGGLTTSPGSAYDNDLAARTVTIVSTTPGGEDIPLGAGNSEEYIRIPAVSKDGSHILMSTAGPGGTRHLYMRVGDSISYDVSVGQDGLNHAVKFVGMTSDGTRVYFTSSEQLTADDTDSSIDLFRWTEGGSVTRLSTGTTQGNSDACNASWISKCDIEVIPTERGSAITSSEPPVDSPLASDSGEFYFYSPEELDGSRGAFGSRNLYVYRDGAPQHVATLDPSRPATRLEVTPDGRLMAFITSTKLTGYDNAGRAVMYRYDSASRSLTCVSCRPDGEPPAGLVEGSQNGLFIANDGRVFFSTEDALVPRDADGIRDVYEYVDGRAQLITSGAGDAAASQNQRIGLVGVSANGVDVYFATVDQLVPEDENGPFLKFYDARTNGGFPFNKPPAPCEAADECHGTETEDPAPLVIGTGADLGAGGNLPLQSGRSGLRKGRRKARRCGRRHSAGGCRRGRYGHSNRSTRGGRNG